MALDAAGPRKVSGSGSVRSWKEGPRVSSRDRGGAGATHPGFVPGQQAGPRADPALGDGLADRRRGPGPATARQLDPGLPVCLAPPRRSAGAPRAEPADGGSRADAPTLVDTGSVAAPDPDGRDGQRARPAAVDRASPVGRKRACASRERGSAAVLDRRRERPLPQPPGSLQDRSRFRRRGRGGGLSAPLVRLGRPCPSAELGIRPLDRAARDAGRGDRSAAPGSGRFGHLAHPPEPRHQLRRRSGPARDRRGCGLRLSLLRARQAPGVAAGDRPPGAVRAAPVSNGGLGPCPSGDRLPARRAGER